MKKAIDDKRKEVKNQYMIPYNDFEGKAKELMQIIDQPIGLISQQITEMEERRKAEKKAKIGALYDSLVGIPMISPNRAATAAPISSARKKRSPSGIIPAVSSGIAKTVFG